MNYFICGEKLLAFNGKCATSTFAWAILRQFYPEIVKQLNETTHWANGEKTEDQMLHRWVPKRVHPRKHKVAQIVREPVERFCSAVAFMNLENRCGSIEEIIDDLLNETHSLDGINGTIASNFHFRHQSRFKGDITYFRMDQLQECADWLGIKVPLKTINKARQEKPVLTAGQKELIREYYADDVALWETIKGKDSA
jgi:hypothetical protein|tara:strand:- start:681 stop:1271 length:591 start_codon:yes stop_codon:yes gene_type:complete